MKRDFLDRLAHDTEQLREQGLFKPERVLATPQSASVRVAGKAIHQRAIGGGFGVGVAYDPMSPDLELAMLDFVTGAVEFLEQQARASVPPGAKPGG